MPQYHIAAPDGRTLTVEGDHPPSEAEMASIFASVPVAKPVSQYNGPSSGPLPNLGGVATPESKAAMDQLIGNVVAVKNAGAEQQVIQGILNEATQRKHDIEAANRILAETPGSTTYPRLSLPLAAIKPLPPSIGQPITQMTPMGIRVVSMLGGAVATPYTAGLVNPITAAALAELPAQTTEMDLGQRENYSGADALLNIGMAGIPPSRLETIASPLARAGLRALEGGTYGAGYSLGGDILHDRPLNWTQALESAGAAGLMSSPFVLGELARGRIAQPVRPPAAPQFGNIQPVENIGVPQAVLAERQAAIRNVNAFRPQFETQLPPDVTGERLGIINPEDTPAQMAIKLGLQQRGLVRPAVNPELEAIKERLQNPTLGAPANEVAANAQMQDLANQEHAARQRQMELDMQWQAATEKPEMDYLKQQSEANQARLTEIGYLKQQAQAALMRDLQTERAKLAQPTHPPPRHPEQEAADALRAQQEQLKAQAIAQKTEQDRQMAQLKQAGEIQKQQQAAVEAAQQPPAPSPQPEPTPGQAGAQKLAEANKPPSLANAASSLAKQVKEGQTQPQNALNQITASPEAINIGPRPTPEEQAILNKKVEDNLRAQISKSKKVNPQPIKENAPRIGIKSGGNLPEHIGTNALVEGQGPHGNLAPVQPGEGGQAGGGNRNGQGGTEQPVPVSPPVGKGVSSKEGEIAFPLNLRHGTGPGWQDANGQPVKPEGKKWVFDKEAGYITPEAMRALLPVATGLTGAGYGATKGSTPEERLRNAAKGAGAGFVGGYLGTRGVGLALNRAANKESVRNMLYEMSVGRENMPEWYLKLRQTAPMVAFREGWYNTRARVKDLVANLAGHLDEQGLKLPEEFNPYLAGKLFPKVTHEIEEQVKPLVQQASRGISEAAKAAPQGHDQFVRDFYEYLEAQHTPAYNAARKAAGESGHRLTNDQAKAITDTARKNGNKAVFDNLRATYVQPLIDQTRDLLVRTGLISKETMAQWKKDFPDYVPFDRIMPEADTEDAVRVLGGGGPGLNVLSSGVRSAHGSELPVADIMGNIYKNLLDASQRGAKNVVDQAGIHFIQMAEAEGHPVPGVSGVRKPRIIGSSGDTPILERFDPTTMLRARINGHPVQVDFTDPKLAVAFTNLNKEGLSGPLRWAYELNRLRSGLLTRFSFDFLTRNPFRDRWDSAVEALSRNDIGGAAAMLNPVAAVRSDFSPSISYILGMKNAGAQDFEKMVMLGGLPGGWASGTKKEIYDFVRVWEKERTNPAFWTKEKITQFFDFLGEVSEGSTRYAAWRRAKAVGATDGEAALAARDSSLDFNMKGIHTQQANAFYNFFNPAVQSVIKSGKWFVRNPHVLPTILTTFYGLSAATNAMNAHFNPEWKKDQKVAFNRINGFPMIYGYDEDTGEYKVITLPIAQSLRPIKALMDFVQDWEDGALPKENVPLQLGKVMMVALDAANPLGNSGNAMTTLVPSQLRPAVEVAANTAWSGRKIVPQQMEDDPLVQEWAKYFPDINKTPSGRIALSTTNALHEYFGISVSPEKASYLLNQYLGGGGRNISELTNLAGNLISGQFQAKDIPGAAGVISRYTPSTVQKNTPEVRTGLNVLSDKLSQEMVNQTARTQQAEQYLLNFNKATPAQKQQLLSNLGQGLNSGDPMAKKIISMAQKAANDPLENRLDTAPLNVRAEYAAQRLLDAKPEERTQLMQVWSAQRWIQNPDVQQAIMAKLNAQRIFNEARSKPDQVRQIMAREAGAGRLNQQVISELQALQQK